MKYVRPMDLHDRFYKCERDGCVEVVEIAEYHDLAAKVVQIELLASVAVRERNSLAAHLEEDREWFNIIYRQDGQMDRAAWGYFKTWYEREIAP